MSGQKEHKTDIHTDSKALQAEGKVVSKWSIMDESGTLIPVSEFDFRGHDNLKKLADYEISKTRVYNQAPPHIKLMQKLELVDYEPASDPGNMRFYPNGKTIKNLLERYVAKKVRDYGAVEVETPIMYDHAHPALDSYLHRFPSRHYIVKSDDRALFLRFSACFGQFMVMHDAQISYKQMPFKVYELAKSFRRELSGELTGLKRLRAFTMPDMHTACRDIDEAKAEFTSQFRLCQQVMGDVGLMGKDYEVAIRFTDGMWQAEPDFIKNLVRQEAKKPALVETWNYRYAYFDPKFEFNIIDSTGKATALSTVQMDHENGQRFDITFTDQDGIKKNPIILHCSPSGAIERLIYAFLERAAMKEAEGAEVPALPMWLAPTQVRLLPVTYEHLSKCVDAATKLEQEGIRTDVDDTALSISKRIKGAEQEWVPVIGVIGDKELSSGKIAVRIRGTTERQELDIEQLKALVRTKENAAFNVQTPTRMLSKRPIYRG